VKKTEMNFVKRIAHARTSKFVFFVFFNIPDILKVLKSNNSQGRSNNCSSIQVVQESFKLPNAFFIFSNSFSTWVIFKKQTKSAEIRKISQILKWNVRNFTLSAFCFLTLSGI
jgi:hypothetical protein